MRELTKIPSWIIFLLLLTPFVVGGIFKDMFCLIGFFLSIYWVISVGKFGTLLLELDKLRLWVMFNFSSRLIFISLLLHFFLAKYDYITLSRFSNSTLIHIVDIVFYISLVFVTIYSSFIYNKLITEKTSVTKVLLTGILFWFFPIGVWFLQPQINKNIGENLE